MNAYMFRLPGLLLRFSFLAMLHATIFCLGLMLVMKGPLYESAQSVVEALHTELLTGAQRAVEQNS